VQDRASIPCAEYPKQFATGISVPLYCLCLLNFVPLSDGLGLATFKPWTNAMCSLASLRRIVAGSIPARGGLYL
jgi:hypothetical protein